MTASRYRLFAAIAGIGLCGFFGIRRQPKGPASWVLYSLHIRQGESAMRQERYDDAVRFYLAASQEVPFLWTQESRRLAVSLRALGVVCAAQGRWSQAESALNGSLEISEKIQDRNMSLSNLRDLEQVYLAQQKQTEAERILWRLLRAQETLWGFEDGRLLPTYAKLASQYYNRGEFSKAEPFYSRIAAIIEARNGPDHVSTAKAFETLGDIRLRENRPVEAEAAFKHSLTIFKKHPDSSLADINSVLHKLAALDRLMGRNMDVQKRPQPSPKKYLKNKRKPRILRIRN